jgi:hypothetical protein
MTTREPGPEHGSRPDRPGPERSFGVPLDLLLEGHPLPDGDPARWEPAAQVLAALTSAPESSELAGEAQALAAFRARGARSGPPSRVRRRSPGRLAWLCGTRPAVAAATGAVLMGGLLAVAYAGDLPGAAQRLAHDTIDAPPPGGPAATIREPGPAPGPASPRPPGAGPAGSPSRSAAATPGHRAAHGSRTGSPHHHRASGSAPGTERGSPTGHPGQSGHPSDSPTPGRTQQPSPPASGPPSAGATPSPSAAPSATRRSGPRYGPPSAVAQNAPP